MWNGTGTITDGVAAIKQIDLTGADGVAKVWTGSEVVNASNQGALVKSEKVTLTFATDHSATTGQYAGTYPVTISASGHVRLATSYEDSQADGANHGIWDSNDYVGYYYHTGEKIDPSGELSGSNVATANQVINLGFVVVANDGSFTYKGIGTNGVVGDTVAGLVFYVSISPEYDDRAETVDNAGQNYGTITPVIGTWGTDFSA